MEQKLLDALAMAGAVSAVSCARATVGSRKVFQSAIAEIGMQKLVQILASNADPQWALNALIDLPPDDLTIAERQNVIARAAADVRPHHVRDVIAYARIRISDDTAVILVAAIDDYVRSNPSEQAFSIVRSVMGYTGVLSPHVRKRIIRLILDMRLIYAAIDTKKLHRDLTAAESFLLVQLVVRHGEAADALCMMERARSLTDCEWRHLAAALSFGERHTYHCAAVLSRKTIPHETAHRIYAAIQKSGLLCARYELWKAHKLNAVDQQVFIDAVIDTRDSYWARFILKRKPVVDTHTATLLLELAESP